jgi:predicted dehydrogenase
MRVIQVGVGGMGGRWLETVLASPEVEYAAFVEINAEIAEAQAARFGLDRARIFPSLPAALDALRADGVAVNGVIDVTPPQFHREIAFAALDAGLPVLSEKPLAATYADAQAIVERANATGVLHMVAQNYRYTPPAQTLKAALASGIIGEVGAVAVEFYKGVHFGGFRAAMPYPLIIDMAIHHFDMLRFFLDDDAVSVYGRSWNPAWSWNAGDSCAAVSLRFKGGVTATYNGSWVSTGRDTSWNADWRFDGAQGVLMMRDDVVMVQRWDGGSDGFANVYAAPEVVPTVAPARVQQAHLLHEFRDAVMLPDAVQPVTTCQDNIRSLGIIFDAVASFERGTVIERAAGEPL